MHVVYDYQAFSLQTHGGVSRYFSEIAPRIGAMPNCTTTILAGAHRNDYLASAGPRCIGFRVPHIRGLRLAQAVFNTAMTTQWLRRHHPDVVHETYYKAKGFGRSGHRATVVTVHDMIHEKFPEQFPAYDTTARRKAAAVRRADAVICVSANTKKDLLERLPLDPAKVHVVHHGCVVKEIIGEAGEATASRPFLLYVGPRAGYKNWRRLIAAIGLSPVLRSTFDLVCFGGRSFARDEVELIRQVAVAGTATSITHVTGDDATLERLYSHASAFIYPSIYEGFGLPPLEAMARGCPVVCSNTSSLPEVFAGAAEMFDPLDASAVAAAIESVVLSSERTGQLRELGLTRARSLSWTTSAVKTLAVYKLL